ncbi:MAG: M20/M25/M40 family metallo-hydrolase [Balneolaceae bacterium]|nr:M20/M25/M40 family metallo-hydrolase [Balneolaceae bacterium]
MEKYRAACGITLFLKRLRWSVPFARLIPKCSRLFTTKFVTLLQPPRRSMGATAELEIQLGYPATCNDPALTEQMVPTLQQIAGEENVVLTDAITGAEDFSFFQKEVPGFYFFTGGMPEDMKPSEAAPHHTPDFYIEEEGMKLGVKSLARLTVDYTLQESE